MPAVKGKKAPRKRARGLKVKAWWVLRKHHSVTMSELLVIICKGHEKSPESNLHRWFVRLVQAGIVARTRESDGKLTSNGVYRYKLIKDLGPLAPVVCARSGRVYDHNHGQVVFEGLGPRMRRAEDLAEALTEGGDDE
jgi:hypothetical protein